MKIKVKCNYCGKEIFIKPSRLKYYKNHFCSVECSVKYKKGKHHSPQSEFKKGHIPPNKGKGNKIICEICGKEYFKPKCHIRKHQFCSMKCFAKWLSENHSGKNGYNYKGGKPKCKICGKELSYTNKNNLCLKCYSAMRHNNIGKNNNNGMTSVREKIRKSPEWKQWRETIYKRDNFTCQKCGARYVNGGKRIILHPHHCVVPFSRIINCLKEWVGIDKLYESALKFSPLWDTENGQTLCVKCHKETHSYLNGHMFSKYSIKENTRICSKCNRKYPATFEYFYKDKNSPDGFISVCKDCVCEYRIKHRNTIAE